MRTLCGTVLAAVCAVFSCNAEVVRDIQYDSSIGRFGLGDLFLPDEVSGETSLVLTIHGGGWSSGDRASWAGVARFFTERLGFAAFNIEYRLASVSNRWPACGDDCIWIPGSKPHRLIPEIESKIAAFVRKQNQED